MKSTFQLITPPAAEPVTRAEAKNHLRLETDLDDDDVDRLIVAARQWAEEYCWRGFVTQVWEFVADEFPSCDDGFKLPRGNLAGVTSVKSIDANGVEQTMSSGDYSVDSTREPGRLRLGYGKSWPSSRSQWDAVRVRYTVGWSADQVPAPIKQAVLLLIAGMYENRAPEVSGTIVSPLQVVTVKALLESYRLSEFV